MTKVNEASVSRLQALKEEQKKQRAVIVARMSKNAISDWFSAANATTIKVTEEEKTEFLRITKNATIVFTCPSEETLKADKESETPRFTKGKKIGSVQWYKKTQVVESMLSVWTSYNAFLSYMISKETQVAKDEKKTKTAVETLTNKEFLNMLTDAQREELLKALQK